jgi:adenylate cyclase
MALEIERKFLVVGSAWRACATRRQRFIQGYLSRTRHSTVRIRCSGTRATITVKGARKGCVRDEFEYAIPASDGEEMLRRLCVKPLIEKVRHWVEHASSVWQIDEYCGQATGLVLAEIELVDPDQAFAIPEWAGLEVTYDLLYRSSSIAKGLWREASGLGIMLQPST